MPSSSSNPRKSAAKSVKSAPAARAAKPAAKAAAASRSRVTARKPSAPAVAAPALTHELIAQRAHDLYVQSGHQGHRQVEFWLEAERQLREGMKA